MSVHGIVLDTSVLFAGLYSSRGASFKLLSLIGEGTFSFHLSVPLVLEYEETLKDTRRKLGLTLSDIDDFLNYICVAGKAMEHLEARSQKGSREKFDHVLQKVSKRTPLQSGKL